MTTTNSGETKSARASKAAPKDGTAAANKDNVIHLPQSARDRVRNLTDIAREHPVATVAGGLALGLFAGLLVRKNAFGKLARGASAMAEVATLAGITLGREALEKAEAAGSAGKDLSRQARDRAGAAGSELLRQGEKLAHRAGDLLSPAEDAASDAIEAGHRFLRKAADLVQKARA